MAHNANTGEVAAMTLLATVEVHLQLESTERATTKADMRNAKPTLPSSI